MILLDTDICVEILRGNRLVIERRASITEDVAVCFMTVGELFYGASKSAKQVENRLLVEHLLLSMPVLESDYSIMHRFGELKAIREKKGEKRSDADLLIASVALIRCTRLITGNIAHFENIPGLVIENWIR